MAKNKADTAGKTKGSESFKKAKSKAEDYVNDPEKLNALIDKASRKATSKKGPLDGIWAETVIKSV